MLNIFRKRQKLKVRATLSDLKLLNVPPRTGLMFIKAKFGKDSFVFPPKEIVKNTVSWNDSIDLEGEIFATESIRSKSKVRLSVRLENISGNGFTRFGIAELDVQVFYYGKESKFELLLDNCCFNTKIAGFLSVNETENLGLSTKTESEAIFKTVTPNFSPFRSRRSLSISGNGSPLDSLSIEESDSSTISVDLDPTELQRLKNTIDEIFTDVINENKAKAKE